VIKSIHHIALRTTDLERMADFYSQALGFTRGMRLDFGDGTYLVQMELDGAQVELFGGGKTKSEDKEAVGYIHLALTVDDVEAECERLKGLGCEFYIEPVTVQGLRVAFFRDPDGNSIELIQEIR
jgi:lactoylglutathione lyase